MRRTTLAILGAGSVRCSPPVLASLATYFGERPLDIRLYDSDEERLDLFDRMARALFATTKATHTLLYRLDPAEALEEADKVVLQIGTNCARKYLRARGQGSDLPESDYDAPEGSLQKDGYMPISHDVAVIQRALDLMLELLPPDAEVLSLQEPGIELPYDERFRSVSWPAELTLEERLAVPHQALRWIKGEDYAHSYLGQLERSPVKAWLDGVTTAEWSGGDDRKGPSESR